MAGKAKPKAKAKAKRGVCERGRDLIRQGKTNQQVLVVLEKEFPQSNIKIGGVGWLRNKLREAGEKVKTNRELAEARAPKKKAA